MILDIILVVVVLIFAVVFAAAPAVVITFLLSLIFGVNIITVYGGLFLYVVLSLRIPMGARIALSDVGNSLESSGLENAAINAQEDSQIGYAESRGGSTRVYSAGKRQILNLPGDLVSHSASAVTVRRGNLVVTYDVKGRQINQYFD